MTDFANEPLTPNFRRWEFTVSETATRRGISNVPSGDQWLSLASVAETCAEPARGFLGPLRISSGYRCPALNAAIGGAIDSQHMKGEALDLIPYKSTLQTLFRWLYENAPFDELIWEFGEWVHVSHVRDGAQRHQSLLATKANGKTVYTVLTDAQIKSVL